MLKLYQQPQLKMQAYKEYALGGASTLGVGGNAPQVQANTGNAGAKDSGFFGNYFDNYSKSYIKTIMGGDGGSPLFKMYGNGSQEQSNKESGGGGFFNKIGGWNTVGSVSSALSSLIPTYKSEEVKAADAAFDAASDAMMTINPMVGGIMKAGGLLSDGLNALGVRTDQVTGTDKFLGSKFMTLTPTGLINNTFTTKLDALANNQDVQEALAMSDGGYGGFRMGWDDASKYSGKTIGFFNSADEYNRKIHEANRQMSVLQRITGRKKRDDLLTAQMEDRWNQGTMNLLNGGFGNISFGRLGLKIEILPKVHAILNKPKVVDTLTEWEEETLKFKEGGKMNVIPEGSLHARLHHMENAEGLTKKGIPVVSIAEGGELEQQAEIELNEIIFNLEVTTELEKLMQDGSDSAAIEAGKLLVKEIFENTDDRTGLIKQLEPEKKEPTAEDIVKYHKVFQGGGILPTLKSIEELVDYAIKQNPAFVQRIGPDMGYAEYVDENGKTQRGTHLLSYAEDNDEYVVYPEIQMENGRLQYEKDWKKAFDKAKRAGNVIRFKDKADAEKFTKEYKKSKQWKQYFDIWDQRYGSFKNGGIIERINNLSPEQIEKLTKFLNEV